MVCNDRDRVPNRVPNKSVELRCRSIMVVYASLVLALAALAGCGSPLKAELDREVNRLCAIDGGVHVYEVVRLPKEDFGPDGTVFPQYRTRIFTAGRYGPEYVGLMANKVLVAGNPSLHRLITKIIRRSDDKVLGEVVIYGRRGGDGPGISEPSHYSCPKGPDLDAERQVFQPKEK